ncbi:uncharacterized protein LOC134829399 [Culicoides brevitarsis]|uniref:uncharacterized protein LOC134829399 n=1 Tax=Culicoides brevitarsis TaxID=469753 RepID=UPI00307C0105
MDLNNTKLSLREEIKQNWDTLPVKYDNFKELYAPVHEEDDNIEQIQKKRNFENTLKYAITRKSLSPPIKTSSKESLTRSFKSQIIQKEHIESIKKENSEKQALIKRMDEAIEALEKVIEKEERPENEKEVEQKVLLTLVQKDFIKQQRFLVTAVTKLFKGHEKEANFILNELFDAHFEDVDKFIDVTQRNEEIVKILVESCLVERFNENSNKIKLRPIL